MEEHICMKESFSLVPFQCAQVQVITAEEVCFSRRNFHPSRDKAEFQPDSLPVGSAGSLSFLPGPFLGRMSNQLDIDINGCVL